MHYAITVLPGDGQPPQTFIREVLLMKPVDSTTWLDLQEHEERIARGILHENKWVGVPWCAKIRLQPDSDARWLCAYDEHDASMSAAQFLHRKNKEYFASLPDDTTRL